MNFVKILDFFKCEFDFFFNSKKIRGQKKEEIYSLFYFFLKTKNPGQMIRFSLW